MKSTGIGLLLLCILSLQSLTNASRIVGGNFAEKNQFPHQVALLKDGRLYCGGSVVSETWVITAAHCLMDGKNPALAYRFRVLAGVLEHKNQTGGQLLEVRNVYPHEGYGNFFNDIGLVETVVRFVFGSGVQPIPLRRTPLPDGTEMVISGWGRTGYNEELSDRLQYTTMRSIPLKQCTEEIGITYPGIICVVATEAGSHGPCNGDSGGPAVVNNELVGVANFARIGCGVNPEGYANVPFFTEWLNDHMNKV
ncbi:serine protease SP24D-like [Aedes albopictus]|uniref:Peptidase S1 domain-containing protein n=1 Tax=Aedes albopictus TaxID=7160 RepID=A0ABM1ZXF2_AEDAL|nr:serine protease SP24D-like [Aedes albopictus]